MPTAHPLDQLLFRLTQLFPDGNFFAYDWNLRALLALILVGFVCGCVGSLVVAGRMAFFSDALAHCAFAGVSLGFLLFEAILAGVRPASEFWSWVTPVMIAFGLLVGWLIVVVRERTGLSSDTIIGVFFAAAIGLAALLRKLIVKRDLFNLEDFLFGDPLLIRSADLLLLGSLAVLTPIALYWLYNPLLLAGLDASLARARRIPVSTVQLLFVLLLAVVVNVSLRCVGALLVNALLVVPAATAANFGRNLRQVFWLGIIFSISACVLGHLLAWEVEAATKTKLGIPGAVILLSVLLFLLSLLAAPYRRWRDLRQARGLPTVP